jgi:hypothetical protein
MVAGPSDEDRYTAYWWQVGGLQQGIFYPEHSTESVARVFDEAVVDCTVRVPAEPSDYQCLFGDTVEDLLMAAIPGGTFTYEETGSLTVGSELTELQQRQLERVAPVLTPEAGGTSGLFALAVDGEIEVGTLISLDTDHDAFTFYSYDSSDGSFGGFIFTQGSLELVAHIEDNSFRDCTVAASGGGSAPPAPYGPY